MNNPLGNQQVMAQLIAPSETQQVSAGAAMAQLIAPLIFFFVIMYFFLIRPQQKREKKTKAMLASVKVGDNITTIGGICAKVIGIRDDVLTVEVGKDKVNLVIERWAIRDVDKPISAD